MFRLIASVEFRFIVTGFRFAVFDPEFPTDSTLWFTAWINEVGMIFVPLSVV